MRRQLQPPRAWTPLTSQANPPARRPLNIALTIACIRKTEFAISCFHAMAGLDRLYPNGVLFGSGFKMWCFNGTDRVLIEYTQKASNKGLLLEPIDIKNDRYGFVYSPTREGPVPYNPLRNASVHQK